jgi:hypothetical protein
VDTGLTSVAGGLTPSGSVLGPSSGGGIGPASVPEPATGSSMGVVGGRRGGGGWVAIVSGTGVVAASRI